MNLWSELRPSSCPRYLVQHKFRSRPRSSRFASSYSKSSTAKSQYPIEAELKQPAYAKLTNRAIIRLQGPDVVDFLNGLLPARLHPLTKGTAPIYTAFLSAKGRILDEAFLYPPPESDSDGPWYIDVDVESQSALFSHLRKHKLRSKFKLEKVSSEDLNVYYSWPGPEDTKPDPPDLGGQDPRPLMGTRFLSKSMEPSRMLSKLKNNGSSLTLADYNIHRILSGHAEGPRELISNSALPQESNFDFAGGIDFHKGCYLGQELTIRTHHTGVVRKRILPCQIYPSDQQISQDQEIPVYEASVIVHQPPSENNISKMHAKGRAGRSTGKWLGGVGNIGLALCRLEMMTDIQLTAEGTNFDPNGEFSAVWEEGEADSTDKSTLREVKIKPFVPRWLRENIEAGIKARSERSKRRRSEDEEDEDGPD